jgi:hypothetical protein
MNKLYVEEIRLRFYIVCSLKVNLKMVTTFYYMNRYLLHSARFHSTVF